MTVAPYGTWPSPITPAAAAAHSGASSWPAVDGGCTWWCRTDPATAEIVLWRRDPDGHVHRVLDAGWSVRNGVNGYGGRPYAIDGERLIFTAYGDRRIHLGNARSPAEPVPLTPIDPDGTTTWYADLWLPSGSDRLWCVRETTRSATGPEDSDPAPRTSRDIVSVPLSGAAADDASAVVSAARSHHFVSNVRVSPDGRRLLWIGWNHPTMPWQGTELLVAPLTADGRAGEAAVVLGGPDVSVPQAEWADDNTILAMADPNGWWNLHRVSLGDDPELAKAECLLPLDEDCAGALWRVGATWFATAAGRVVFAHGCGAQQLSIWDPASGSVRDLAPGWTQFGSSLVADAASVVTVAGGETHGYTVLRVPLDGSDVIDCVGADEQPDGRWLSTPRRRAVSDANGQAVHFAWFPPTNPDCTAPPGELPPLLIDVHGGPTGAADVTPSIELSLFTSRGFAAASVDYGGSTGYGRAYRERLDRMWGIVDVADALAVAQALARSGEVDPHRIAVRGGSAGGWTALACLTSSDVFCAGAVYYPISDALHWSGGHTHDFESRYLESLIGRLPEDRDRYERVSPLLHVDRVTAPIVMLQGADDFICPPEHATTIIDAVAARGLWHRLEIFPGEGHGFRKATSVETSLRRELELYAVAMNLSDAAEQGVR
jgi:dipeptidyl aminopeptidase/acylaminoacyl peptidase